MHRSNLKITRCEMPDCAFSTLCFATSRTTMLPFTPISFVIHMRRGVSHGHSFGADLRLT